MEEVNNKIIPVGTVLTMAGTGSEMNGGSVITNRKTKQKIGRVFGDNAFPKFSILNPELTYTLPYYQMTAGFFDIMSHILEQYFSGSDDNTSDYLMEGLLKSLEADAQHDFIEALNSLAGEMRYDVEKLDSLIDEARQSLAPKKKPKYDIKALKDELNQIKKNRNEL